MDIIKEEETFEYTILPLKNLEAHTEVWVHYCKLLKNGTAVDSEYVYCTKCLENGLSQK